MSGGGAGERGGKLDNKDKEIRSDNFDEPTVS